MAMWIANTCNYPLLEEVAEAIATSELRPLDRNTSAQTIEEEMGLSYEELSVIARLRKIDKCGPLSMYTRLIDEMPHTEPKEIAKKVKHFFTRYSINRHKASIMPPSLCIDKYGSDDNRFDLRQLFYETNWTVPFGEIDDLQEKFEQSKKRST